MNSDEIVTKHCIGKKIVGFNVDDDTTTITLDDGSILRLNAWDDGGFPLGVLTLSDGSKIGFCGGDQ